MFLEELLIGIGLNNWINFSIFLIVVIISAEIFVKSIIKLGRRYDIPEAVLGVFSAVGTSLPEVSAALMSILIIGSASLGAGVIVGSCIWNICGILGISTLIGGPQKIRRVDVYGFGTIELVLTICVCFILLDLGGFFSLPSMINSFRLSILSIFLLTVYFLIVFAIWKERGVTHPRTERLRSEGPLTYLLLVPLSIYLLIDCVEGLTSTAVNISSSFAIPEYFIGFFIIAIASSIPELVATSQASLQSESEVSVGSILGTNVVNLSFGIAIPIIILGTIEIRFLKPFELFFLVLITLMFTVFLATDLELTRREGITLMGIYIFLVLWLIFQ